MEVGKKLKLGWLYGEEKPEFDGDIHHLAKDQKPIDYEKIENTVNIGSIIYNMPMTYEGSLYYNMFYENVWVITTTEGFDKLTGGNVDYHAVGVNLNGECTDEIDNEMQNLFTRVKAGTNGHVTSLYEKR